MKTRLSAWRRRAVLCLAVTIFVPFFLTDAALSQAPREQVRVPKRFANVHAGPSSTDIVLLLVSQGTILPVIERRNEWVIVQLSPNLKETGMPMRWYKNETQGFMHESTVETVKP